MVGCKYKIYNMRVHVLTKEKFLYENELINDQNDYNVNKQIFIYLFSTCKYQCDF